MKRQNEDFAKKLESQEAELRKNVEDQRARRREEDARSVDGLSLGERLLQKQIELEEALRRNQMLSIRLEKLQKSTRETVIPIDPPSTSLPVHHPAAKQAVTVVDTVMFRVISVLRNYPMARIFVAIYFVLLHLWVFFIVLTYTPEMHDATGTLPDLIRMAANVPASLKPIAHYIKIANENSSRDPVVYYWCELSFRKELVITRTSASISGLFYAVQNAMHLDKSSPEALKFLTGLLSTLETIKKQLVGNEAITNEVVAQAHLENFALKLFNFADVREKAGQVDKSVVHAFYTAGHIMDVLSLFGEVDEPFLSSKKYAKWKSTQIFSCLKEGKPYIPSNPPDEGGVPAPTEHKYPDEGSTSAGGTYYPQAGAANYGGGPFGGVQSSQTPSNFGLPNVPGGPNAQAPSIPAIPQHSYSNPTPVNTLVPEISGLNIEGGERKPSVEAFNEARKFAKYALSAMDYEDTRAVVENLRKALALMEHF
ncbi:hypothetical protein COOONC_28628 [Cooperia oncophora]